MNLGRTGLGYLFNIPFYTYNIKLTVLFKYMSVSAFFFLHFEAIFTGSYMCKYTVYKSTKTFKITVDTVTMAKELQRSEGNFLRD